MKLNDLMNMWGRSASAGLSSLESFLHNKFNQVGQDLQKQIPPYNPQNENPVVKSVLTAVAPGVQAFLSGGFKGYANQMATAKAPSPETLVMGFMGGGMDENVASGLKGISEDLLPLAKEALKYDSAEEFVNAQFKKPEYGMGHRPSYEGMPPSHNLLEGETLPRDVYKNPDYSISSGRIRSGDKAANESWDALQKIKGKPDAEITIYRASPKNELNAGDWVTFSKDYAKQSVEGVEKVNSFKVKAKDVIFAGDDINEFGYYPKSKLIDIFNKVKGK